MNIYNARILVLSLGMAFLVSACKKRWFDERNKYIGKWNMQVITDDWSLGRNPMHIIDTATFVGLVNYSTKHANKGTLQIEFIKGAARQFTVSEDGTLSVCGKVGSISTTQLSIQLNSINSCSFGRGSGTDYRVTASKH